MHKPILTREHGSWALLFVPLLIGVIRSHPVADHALLAFAALGWFLCYVPTQTLLRARRRPLSPEKRAASALWATIYGSIATVASGALVIEGPVLLIVIGFAAVVMFIVNWMLTRRAPKTIPGDLVAMLGLTLGAPAAMYVATGTLDDAAFVVWILNVLFFGATVFHVHMKIAAAAMKDTVFTLATRLRAGKWNLGFLLVMWVVIHLFDHNRVAACRPLLYLPISIQIIAGTLRLKAKTDFKKLGFLLLAQSILFALLVAFSRYF